MALFTASNPKALSTLSNPSSLKSLIAFFCSSPAQESIPNHADSTPSAAAPPPPPPPPPPLSESPRGKHRNPEKIEDLICRMMSSRAWTTRLQNSVRKLVPQFDHELVYNVLHSARNAEHALQFYRWVERAGLIRHNRETHFKIIQILGRASKLNHARCILLDMPKNGVEWDEDIWIEMIDSYGKAGIVQESVKLFQKMEELNVERTIKSYDALFKVINRRGRYMMAKRYFNKMIKEGIEPTKHTYNLMLWGFFLSTRIETAIRFFEEMKSKEISPDVVTYNTMINGFFRVKKIEEMEKYFIEMKGRNIEPTVITYTTLIKGYISVNRIEDGLRIFEEMKSFGIKPTVVTYSTLLPGLCEAEKMSEAGLLLQEMVEKHIAPNDNSIFIRLIVSQCKIGDLEAAHNVLKSMIRLSIPTEAGHYGVLIENYCNSGMYEKAVKLVDKVIEKEIILKPHNSSALPMEASSYNTIIKHLCENNQTEKAETLLRQLMKMGVQDPIAFSNLISGHAKQGTPDSAYELLKIMVRRKIPSQENAYVSLIQSYLDKNEPADAKMGLDHMILNGHVPELTLVKSVMESLFNDGRVQTASRVMLTMVEKCVNEKEKVKDQVGIISNILEALLMRGHVEEALGRIEMLINNDLKPDFDNIISVLCEKGKVNAALKVLDFGLERDCEIEFKSYDKVLDGLLLAGRTLNAYSILCKILEKGGVNKSFKKSSEELIKSLNDEGNTRQADILKRMMNGGDDNKKGKKKVVLAN